MPSVPWRRQCDIQMVCIFMAGSLRYTLMFMLFIAQDLISIKFPGQEGHFLLGYFVILCQNPTFYEVSQWSQKW